MKDQVAVLDFGSQLTQLVARRVRDAGVYSEVFPYDIKEADLRKFQPKGIILSGSDQSTLGSVSPKAPSWIWDFGVPVLGLCYGMQTMAAQLGGETMHCARAEFGYVEINVQNDKSPLFKNVASPSPVWMSHSDQVKSLPPGFICLASSASCPYSSMAHQTKPLYGIQFHPEVTQTCSGREIFRNFLFQICQCSGPTWNVASITHQLIDQSRAEVAGCDGDVVLGLSGGVDSSVVAAILHRAIGSRLKCVIIDTGLMRKDEVANVMVAFKKMLEQEPPNERGELFIEVVDASERFFDQLSGVTDPEAKRKIIGREFIEVFNEVSAKFNNVTILAQGTIYPDVIESAHVGNAALIKTHHNVGGLPDDLRFKLLEPIRQLFKDEVRQVGEALGLPHDFLWRHPFPGPGLGVRVLGEVTKERALKCQAADAIFMEEIRKNDLYYDISQALAALIPVKAVAVKGDGREYDEMIALRAIKTEDFMTAQCVELPSALLRHISRRICNEVRGVTRVLYDYTDKPPATIEYE